MIFNLDTQRYLARFPRTALSVPDRMRGMIGRRFSPEFDGLVFPRCGAIHMLFMSIPLDVLFLDREGKVLAAFPDLRPWRLYAGCRGAATTVELPTGTIAASGTEAGHFVNLNCSLSTETVAKLRRRDILTR